ncbi:MmgE/PrpD family protein [Chloroflexota bacterium]
MARFILETKEKDIPPQLFTVVKNACLDNIGTMLAGSVQPVGRIINEYVRESSGVPEATVVGTGFRTSATLAALANATMGHVLDYDDSSYWHATTSLLPALLAAGEKANTSGMDILVAFVVGVEMASALCREGKYDDYESGFHSTGLFGTMASSAGAARLLGLKQEQTIMALGIAASEACGLQRNNGTMTKPLHAGMACRNGVMAALLAKKGFTAYENIFEARRGFCDVFLGRGRYNLDNIADCLGNPFTFQDINTIKKYPCCGGNHTALDATFALIKEHNIKYDDVVRVDVDTLSYTSPVIRFPDPKRGLEGKFSVRHCLACAIMDGKVDIDSFTDEKVNDPKIKEAREKIFTYVVSGWDSRLDTGETRSNPVTITLKDGRQLSKKIDKRQMKGTATNPLSQEELVAKFKANASLALPTRAVNQAIDPWLNLERVGNIAEALKPVAGG